MTDGLTGDRALERYTGKKVKAEAETGVIEPQAKECQDSQEGPSLAPSEGARPCGHLDFGPLASRTVKQHISVALSHTPPPL